MHDSDRKPRQKPKKQWEPMRLSLLGKVGDVVRSGPGKLSLVGGDPGEMRKQSGGGG